jgi:hypothetical protein
MLALILLQSHSFRNESICLPTLIKFNIRASYVRTFLDYVNAMTEGREALYKYSDSLLKHGLLLLLFSAVLQ